MLTGHSDPDELESNLLDVEITPEMSFGYAHPSGTGDEGAPLALGLDNGIPDLSGTIVILLRQRHENAATRPPLGRIVKTPSVATADCHPFQVAFE